MLKCRHIGGFKIMRFKRMEEIIEEGPGEKQISVRTALQNEIL